MSKIEDELSGLSKILAETAEGTKKRNFAKNLAGILAGTGIALGVDWLGNNKFDNIMLDVAAGSGLYDGLSSGFGKGILGLGIAISPEVLDFARYAITYGTGVFSEFSNSESFQDLAYKILAYGGAYAVGTGIRYLGKLVNAEIISRIFRFRI